MAGITRRAFLIAAGAGLAPRIARARPSRTLRVGVLLPLAGLAAQPHLAALRESLAAHGLLENASLHLEVRHASHPAAESRELAAARPDALFACTAPLARALARATRSIPIVFAWVADPVAAGLVKSYARPGTNLTGVANRYYETAVKRIEALHELVPSAKRVSVVAGVLDETMDGTLAFSRAAADRLGMELKGAQTCSIWTAQLGEALADGADAVLAITPFAAFGMPWTSQALARFAIERRLPTMFSDLESVALGGLVSYGNSFAGDVRQAAGVLARVLEGANPAEIPVELAARFELALNLASARAIGTNVPPAMLLRADRVIG